MARAEIQEKHIKVDGVLLRYFEAGEGDPILFLAGMPATANMWRDVLATHHLPGRSIALDFVSFQKAVPWANQAALLKHFIQQLKLERITLIMHGMSTLAGLSYALEHEDNCIGLGFFEPFLGPLRDEQPLLLLEALHAVIKDELNEHSLMHLFQQAAPALSDASISKDYIAPYQQQFSQLEDLFALLTQPMQGELGTTALALSKKLSHSQLPKLLLYALPGFMLPLSSMRWAKAHWPQLQLVEMPEAYHLIPSADAGLFAKHVNAWRTQCLKHALTPA